MSATARNQVFSAVHTVGALLPVDILLRISEGRDVTGCQPADYGVIGKRSVRDDAERHWDYLKGVWSELRDRLPVAPEAGAPADPTGYAISQWVEPLFAELGFGRLTQVGAAGLVSDDGSKTFAISHRWNHVPLHVTAWNVTLDGHPGGHGTVRPQSLVQECLNRTDTHLWAALTNGRQVRLLRDSNALATASYIEFDLEAIFDGELFSEFVLLYRLLHVSRFTIVEGASPSSCWLEKWRLEAIDSGIRALDHQRDAVQKAITTLGTGFLKHPANAALRHDLDVQAYHAALLRLVYRMIFLFVAEDRGLLHDPQAPAEARRRYAAYFSSQRLRQHAMNRRGTSHTDLYRALWIVLEALGDEDGRPELALTGLGGIFDDTPADAPLHGLVLANADLLEAVRHLCRVRDHSSARWRQADYQGMDAEELGSIYESLLELVPKHSAADLTFELVNRSGNDRKKTGSYYTPSSLIAALLDSTLDPVIDDAQKRGEQKATAAGEPDPSASIVAELLALTVCDPACGSGHFLVATARRIAKRIAAVREGNPEPTTDAVRHASREVIARCIYGVDLNPMAVELAKVSLWMEAMEPGKALSFLDAHIKHGNSLIGATPALLRDGIPSKAFKFIEGDDHKVAKSLERQNDQERSGQGGLFNLPFTSTVNNTALASDLLRIAAAPSETLNHIRIKSRAYRDWEISPSYRHAKRVADAWCAAILWRKTADAPTAITDDLFRAIQKPQATSLPRTIEEELDDLCQDYRFFHWHLEFPDVFVVEDDEGADPTSATGWSGGFSCVIGNPPWDELEFKEKEYFSIVDPAISALAGAKRRSRILQWEESNLEASAHYRAARRKVKATFHFAGDSGAYPLCARGLTAKGVTMLQVDQLFAERCSAIASSRGRFGIVIPTVVATSAGAQYLFSSLASRGGITSIYDFDNRKPLFLGVDSRYKFCLLSLVGSDLHEPSAKLAFFMSDITDLEDGGRVFELSPEEIALINPNTGTLPIFRTRRDADLTASIYRRFPVLWNDTSPGGNAWAVTFKRLFDMTDDSDLFRTRDELETEGWHLVGNVFERESQRMLPVYEGKMAHHFDHRWNTFYGIGNDDHRNLTPEEKEDPAVSALPRYWVPDLRQIPTVRNGKPVKVPGVSLQLEQIRWNRGWTCGWRDIARTTDERTAIPALLPFAGVGNKFPLMLPAVPAPLAAALIAIQSSLVFDYVSRQKLGSASMSLFIWKQLPVPTPASMEPHAQFITPRILELTYTTHDMGLLAADLGDREGDPPFRWKQERRTQIRAELDAYFFHLYGVVRDDVDYILETFQTENGGLKNNDIARYGTYRTKDMVLAEYDRMTPAVVSLTSPLIDEENYVSALTPPPGQGPRHPAAVAVMPSSNVERL